MARQPVWWAMASTSFTSVSSDNYKPGHAVIKNIVVFTYCAIATKP